MPVPGSGQVVNDALAATLRALRQSHTLRIRLLSHGFKRSASVMRTVPENISRRREDDLQQREGVGRLIVPGVTDVALPYPHPLTPPPHAGGREMLSCAPPSI